MTKHSLEEAQDFNVVPISPRQNADTGLLLEEVFRQKRTVLIEYLRYRLGSAGDAQDAAQAAFLRLWERRDSLHGDSLASLLFVTARNIANDYLRSQTRQSRLISEYQNEPNKTCADMPDKILADKYDLVAIRSILMELPVKCRTAFISYKFEEQNYDEIAERMGVTPSMVRKHVTRAVAHCVARFAEMEEWV